MHRVKAMVFVTHGIGFWRAKADHRYLRTGIWRVQPRREGILSKVSSLRRADSNKEPEPECIGGELSLREIQRTISRTLGQRHQYIGVLCGRMDHLLFSDAPGSGVSLSRAGWIRRSVWIGGSLAAGALLASPVCWLDVFSFPSKQIATRARATNDPSLTECEALNNP